MAHAGKEDQKSRAFEGELVEWLKCEWVKCLVCRQSGRRRWKGGGGGTCRKGGRRVGGAGKEATGKSSPEREEGCRRRGAVGKCHRRRKGRSEKVHFVVFLDYVFNNCTTNPLNSSLMILQHHPLIICT